MSDPVPRLNAALEGRYRIQRQLGEGGMATVYLADDLRHERSVALKVLKPELAAVVGAERFLAEIKTTANLQHPHILPLFDSGEADGFLFYVMPYVEGESLRDRLDREHQLPVDEAVQIATKVAGALQAAHEQGVIHRDIKPANILLSKGEPLVSDFGIALAVGAAGGGRLTETGLSLGTPHYMSPEQATGDLNVGATSDIYALGCVLYEMLVGDPPHTGRTPQAILAKIITDRPRDLRELRETVSSRVAWSVSKALTKVPADRFKTADEFGRALVGDFAIPESPPEASRLAHRGPRLVSLLPWGIAAVAVVLLLARGFSMTSEAPRNWNVALPDSAPLVFVGESTFGTGTQALDISGDGSHIVYVGQGPSGPQLFVRRTDGFDTRALPGTEGAFHPFFSPDGQEIAFFADDQLKRVSTTGGPVSVVTAAGDATGGSWTDGGEIVISIQDTRTLVVVQSNGLARREISAGMGSLDRTAWPWPVRIDMLPGGEWLLTSCDRTNICAFSLESGELRFLVADGEAVGSTSQGSILRGSHPRFLDDGILLYAALGQNAALAVRFDPETLTTSGQPVQVLSGLRREASGSIHLAVSNDGTAVYVEGNDAAVGELVWVDGQGNEEVLPFDPQFYGAFALSPDGQRIAAPVITSGGVPQLWFLDLTRRRSQIWAGEYSVVNASEFEPDSRYVYANFEDETNRTLRVDTEGGGRGEVIVEDEQQPNIVQQVLADGRLLILRLDVGDLWLVDPRDLPADLVDVAEPITGLGGRVSFAAVSPDGRWLVYTSDAEGRYEVYVVAYPVEESPRPIRLSRDGGEEAVWASAGDGLYYRDQQRWFWVARSDSGDGPFGDPQLFTQGGNYLNLPGLEYAVSQDGSRILVVRSVGDPTTTTLNVITDWLPVLREQVGS